MKEKVKPPEAGRSASAGRSETIQEESNEDIEAERWVVVRTLGLNGEL